MRTGQGGKRPTYRVDLGALRRHAPELFDARDPIAQAIGTWRSEVRREVLELREQVEELDGKLGAIAVAVRELAVAVRARRPAERSAPARAFAS